MIDWIGSDPGLRFQTWTSKLNQLSPIVMDTAAKEGEVFFLFVFPSSGQVRARAVQVGGTHTTRSDQPSGVQGLA